MLGHILQLALRSICDIYFVYKVFMTMVYRSCEPHVKIGTLLQTLASHV